MRLPFLLPLALAPLLAAAPPATVVHGGAGSLRALMDGTDRAAAKALAALKAGSGALDAALAGVVVMEDDPRFNAGTGANIRLDGKTIQMDAACMDGVTGGFGAVAAIERVKNPVLVARKVMDTPHILIVGEGATRFARAMGFPDYDPTCAENTARFRKVQRILQGEDPGRLAAWTRYDWKKAWNFPTPLKEALGPSDTVGCVARDAAGRFAAAISTGGTTITFYGRVGDVPIYGAGIYAGPKGAVACTGNGEDIVKRLVAKTAYDLLAKGLTAQQAVDRTLRAFPADIDLGLVAVGSATTGGGCNYSAEKKAFVTRDYRGQMAWSAAK
ncbi:isoaspartyl peptidase/L-asparaginase [Geothrix sp. 21YS21S-4]|uniref:isoaspartyl peptidase/L-asparaginase n=1 Tax=Geothrix sp. 21YS21S-4 TaxID=3068889 RepID=UPI0027B92949|nr:isoaspartyl peptidase/L-asparaginase [Geothrix sp. 21YS21S-4]